MPVVTFLVAQSSDDVASHSSFSYDDSGIVHGLGLNLPSYDTRTIGLRFQNITIPLGAVIISAKVQLSFSSGLGSNVQSVWRAEDSDNPVTFSISSDVTTGAPHNRRTGASSDATASNASASTAGAFVDFNVKNSVTEAIARSGWNSGNAIVLLAKDNGTANGNTFFFRTFDFGGGFAPKLVIEYFVPSTPITPATDWSALGKEDEKVYVYRVTKADGTYVGIWGDVSDQPEFTQALNTPGTTMTVQLARSPNTKKEERSYLLSATSDRLTTEAGEPFVSVYQTPNNVGPGTDVDLNYNVDIYVIYGEYSRLITATGEYLTTEAGEYLVVGTGSPFGKRIFSGFILDYQTEYGDKNGVTITLASHGYELSHQLVKSGSNTTVSYASIDLTLIAQAVLNTDPGRISYSAETVSTTAVSRPMKFVVNTKYEALQAIYEQTPSGWYWYIDPGENFYYLKPKSETADHTFVAGRDIMNLKVKQTIEALVNEVYFIGGEVTPGTPSSTLYKRYTDATSLTAYPRRGLKRITDRRYTVATNAQALADKDFSRYKNPIFTSPLVISASRNDIETIKLGQTVQFRGFGTFLDSLAPLQIVRRGYTPTAVTLELGDLQEGQVDTIADVQDQLENEQFIDLPNAPS